VPRGMSLKQRNFIAAYMTGIPATQAAIKAGYSAHSAKHIANQLVHENKLVRAEIQRIQQHVATTTEYTTERMMADLDVSIAFAEQTKNANAMVKAVELKGKLTGILRDKIDVTVTEKVDISTALTEARARLVRSDDGLPPPIDGDFNLLPRRFANDSKL